MSVKEHGAKALWALAGSTTSQQKYIAEKTSIPDICSMLLEDTEKLLQVGQLQRERQTDRHRERDIQKQKRETERKRKRDRQEKDKQKA